MVITFQGDNYFKIQSGEFVVLIDPTNARSLKGANIILNTLKPPPVQAEPSTDGIWIVNQGEYEIQGVRVDGWATEYEDKIEKTAYVFELEDIKVGILGYIKKEPSPELLEHFEEIDIMVIPAGKPYLSEDHAAKIIRQIEPAIVIPAFTKETPKKLFAELGQSPNSEEKLVLKKKDISPAAMKVIHLTEK